MFENTQNPGVLDAKTIDLVGGYRLFVPKKDGVFYNGGKPIHMGHVRNPSETYTPTTKKIDTGVYGATRTALEVTTKVEETGAFETISAKDLLVRGLWAGSKAYTSTNGATTAEPWAANMEYAAGDLVIPTAPNGHYYEVTTAGTTSGVEPVAWKTDGGTNQSGTVIFTDRGAVAGGLIIIPRNHSSYEGMLIDVVQSAIEDRTNEIYVAPNILLRGDGYGGGRNSTDETSLKFAYTILDPGGYQIPATLGAFNVERVTGGFDILGVPAGSENATIDKLITGYYA